MASPMLRWDQIGSEPTTPDGWPKPEPPKDRQQDIAGVEDMRKGDWPALPEAALYGLAGDVVRTVEPHSDADPAAILVQMLTAAGNLLGPGLHCTVESTRHALTLYPVLVGETSKARKGTSWGHVERMCANVDALWAKERVTTGLSSAEGLICEVRDDADPPCDRRLLIVQSEYASVLRVMTREGNTLSPLLRAAWGSGNLRTAANWCCPAVPCPVSGTVRLLNRTPNNTPSHS